MVAGLATGGLISMWLAPQSGQETRQEIHKIVVTLRTQAQDRVQSIVSRDHDQTAPDSDLEMRVTSEKIQGS
jgi:gas vesicle protein